MQNVDRVEPAPATAADRVVRLASGLEESETQQVTAAPAHRGGDAVERERGPAPAKPSPVSVAHDLAFASSPPDSPRSDHGRPQPPKESHYAGARVAKNASTDGALKTTPRLRR